jgi:hypothetical protein
VVRQCCSKPWDSSYNPIHFNTQRQYLLGANSFAILILQCPIEKFSNALQHFCSWLTTIGSLPVTLDLVDATARRGTGSRQFFLFLGFSCPQYTFRGELAPSHDVIQRWVCTMI